MKVIKLLICVSLVIGCKSQSTFALYCDIPNGISFDDSAQVFLDKELIGVLSVEKLEADKIKAKISFRNNISLPQNSILTFHDNRLGVSYFEILKGNSKSVLAKNDIIAYSNDASKSGNDSLLKKSKLDLDKFTKPKVIVDSLPE